MLSDSEVRCPDFCLNISSLCRLKIFKMFSDFSEVITLRHSTAFQCNLVHEQTTLSPTNCSKKMLYLFLSFLHNYDFSKKMAFCKLHDEYRAVNLESLGLDTLSNTEASKSCIISKHGLIVHKFDILLP